MIWKANPIRVSIALRWQVVLLAFLLGGVSWLSAAHAQSTWFGTSTRFNLSSHIDFNLIDSRKRSDLTRAEAFLSNSQWNDLIETYRQLVENAGDSLVELDELRLIPLRDFCHLKIAQLPPEALAMYRDQVDSVAESWYRDGVARRDTDRLRQILRESFCSRQGDDALLALGEIAFENGDFRLARSYWQQIHPALLTRDGRPAWLAIVEAPTDLTADELSSRLGSKTDPPTWLFFPDSAIPLADIRARLALASILSGARARAEAEIVILQTLHPEAVGRIAGRKGRYAEILLNLLGSSQHWPEPVAAENWSTFAKTFERTNQLPKKLDPTGVAWSHPIVLPNSALKKYGKSLPLTLKISRQGESAESPLSFHPLIVDDLVLLNNETHIYAYQLKTGEPAWGDAEGVIYRPQDNSGKKAKKAKRTARFGVPRFTMTAYAGRLYARMGNPVTARVTEEKRTLETSTLVCLDLDRQGSKVWQVAPPDENWSFEGSPVCNQDSVYIAIRRSDLTPQAYVDCYDARDGTLRWRRKICSADSPAHGRVDEVSHNLLTLSEGTLYYNTNLGAIASLSADDGQIHWLARYSREESGDFVHRAPHFFRDLNPCMIVQGVVYVAPSDSRSIFALDSTTGAQLWSTELARDSLHLLGVRGDRLIASGQRLWWIDTNSGKVVRRWPDANSAQEGYGRGLIAGSEVFWPLKDQIWIFNALTGLPSQEPLILNSPSLRATGGNLVASRGRLLVAGADHLFCFSEHPEPRKVRPRGIALEKDDHESPHRQATPLHLLAQYEQMRGDLDAAIGYYRQSYQSSNANSNRSAPSPTAESKSNPLGDTAPSHGALKEKLFELLVQRATQLAAQEKWPRSIKLLDEAERIAPDQFQRVQTIVHAAQLTEKSGDIASALVRFKSLRASGDLSRIPVSISDVLGSSESPSGSYSVLTRLYADREIARLQSIGSTASSATRLSPQRDNLSTSIRHSQTSNKKVAKRSLTTRGALAETRPRSPAPIRGGSDSPLPLNCSWLIDGQWQAFLLRDDSQQETTSAAILLSDNQRIRLVAQGSGATLWEHPQSAPVISAGLSGNVLVVEQEDHLEAFSLDHGKRLWRHNNFDLTRNARWTFSEDRILIHRRQGIQCLSTATGETLWEYSPTDASLGEYLLAAQSLVLFQQIAKPSAQDARTTGQKWRRVALRLEDGSIANIQSNQSQWVRQPIADHAGRLLSVNRQQAVESTNLLDGQLQWSRVPFSTPKTSPDLIYDSAQLILVYDAHRALRVATEDGAKLWEDRVELGSQRYSEPRDAMALSADQLFSVSEGVLRSIDSRSGKDQWRTRIDGSSLADRTYWTTRRAGPWVAAFSRSSNLSSAPQMVFVDSQTGAPIYRSPQNNSSEPQTRTLFHSSGIVVVEPNRVLSFSWTDYSD